jgi:hypothetical protein
MRKKTKMRATAKKREMRMMKIKVMTATRNERALKLGI